MAALCMSLNPLMVFPSPVLQDMRCCSMETGKHEGYWKAAGRVAPPAISHIMIQPVSIPRSYTLIPVTSQYIIVNIS